MKIISSHELSNFKVLDFIENLFLTGKYEQGSDLERMLEDNYILASGIKNIYEDDEIQNILLNSLDDFLYKHNKTLKDFCREISIKYIYKYPFNLNFISYDVRSSIVSIECCFKDLYKKSTYRKFLLQILYENQYRIKSSIGIEDLTATGLEDLILKNSDITYIEQDDIYYGFYVDESERIVINYDSMYHFFMKGGE